MFAGVAEARTIGASVVEPALNPVRYRDKHLFYGLPAVQSLPFNGSADRDLGQRGRTGAAATGGQRPAGRRGQQQ